MAVGELTVHLKATTAEFTEPLNQAGQYTRSFGEGVGGHMRNATGAVRLFTHEIGVPLPRELARLVAMVPGLGAAFSTMLPIIGVVAAIEFINKLVEHEKAAKEAAEKLREAELAAATVATKTFNTLSDKILDAQKKADELAGDHLGALRIQLKQINNQKFDELTEAFSKFGGEAEKIMSQLKSSWYEFWVEGSEDVAASLIKFKLAYEDLLAKRDETGAATLLETTLDREEKILALEQKVTNEKTDQLEKQKAYQELASTYHVSMLGGISEKQVHAEQAFVTALREEQNAKKEIIVLDGIQKKNAETAYTQKETINLPSPYEKGPSLAEMLKKQKEQTKHALEEELSATDAFNKALNEQRIKSVEEQTSVQLRSNAEQYEAEIEANRHKLAMNQEYVSEANAADLAALDKKQALDQEALADEIAALDPSKQAEKIKLLNDKKLEMEQKYLNARKKMEDKAEEETVKDARKFENEQVHIFSEGIAKQIMYHRGLVESIRSDTQQLLAILIQSAVEQALIGDFSKTQAAGQAAAFQFKNVMQNVPYPVNLILAPISAAAAFAGVMQYEAGGEVPGSGPVPIMAHGGETVVTRALTEQIKSGGIGSFGGGHITFAPQIHAVDATGVDNMLKKHAAIFNKHFNDQIRKANRKGR